ncbi:TolC family protein [Balneolaceae bacterium YR4-1]|uniref:TolC family protein n=1 Tax=Halalkalibaculum roseum TaxID=2709311 RepID=A0A6M1T711_9BACT|nr:TolC family protein [Halalkalibaculum roseum]NGP76063.1 TolC family protein [Halalkalibaculum roseum]
MQKVILVLTLILAMTLSLQAQDVEEITLQEAIEIALKNNYQLKQASNNLDLAEKTIFSEYSDFLPSISAGLDGSSRKGQQLVRQGDTQVFQDNVTNGLSGRLSASLPLFSGFDNIISLRISEADKLSSEERFQRAKENVIFNTASDFLQLLLNKELLQIAQENLASSEKQLEQVRAQVEVGSRPTVDLYNQESTVASNELTVTRRENNLQISRLSLIRQLQIDPSGNYEFITPELDTESVSMSTGTEYSIENLVDQALENRSDLKADMAELRTLELQLKQAKFDLFPTLSASASLSSSYSDQYFGGGVSFSDQFWDQNYTSSVGLSLNIPIFNNWNRMNRIQSAQVNLKNADLGLENTRLQIIQEVYQAYNDYVSYIKELESTDKALTAAEKTYETQQERYEVGAGTLIELSDANAQFVQAQANRAQAVFSFIFQKKLLDYYLGKLNQDISLN